MAQNDSDVSLDILIRTLAETVGADKVEDALKRVKESANKSGEAHGEAAKGVEKHELSHRQLHKIMHAINELVPGLGNAMMVAFSATAGAVGLVVMAIQALAGWLEKVKEKHHELAEASVAGWREMEQESSKCKDTAADYATTLKHIEENTDALKQKEEQELAVLKAIEAARMKILEAQEQAELAAAKGDPVAEAEVKARYARKKSAEELAAEEDEIALKQKQLGEERAKQAEAKRKSDAAQSVLQQPMADTEAVGEAKHWLEKHKDDITKAQEELDDAQEMLAKHPFGIAGTETTPEMSPEALAERVEEARKKVREAQAAEAQRQETIAAHDREKKRREDEATAATQAYAASTKSVQSKEAELQQAQKVHEINKQAAASVEATQVATELSQAGFKPNSRLGQTLLQDIVAEEGRAHGETMSQAQAAGIQRLVTALKAAGQSQAQINAIIGDMMDLHKSHADKLVELATKLNQLKQNTTTRTMPGAG